MSNVRPLNMHSALLALSLSAAYIAAGCAEITVYETPYAQGRIVDAITEKPIAGASVSATGGGPTSTLSAADGTFVLKSIERMARVLAIAPFEAVSPAGFATASAPGYQSLEVKLQPGVNVVLVKLSPRE